MADSNALRIRRHNLHVAGNHSICRAQFCKYARQKLEREEVESEVERSFVVDGQRLDALDYGFGPEAQDFWETLKDMGEIDPLVQPLALEACRTLDRLRKLDEALRNKTNWLHFRHKEESVFFAGQNDLVNVEITYTIVVDGALREAREQMRTLTSAIAELRMLFAEQHKQNGTGNGSVQPPPANTFLDGLQDDLARRRKTAS